MNYVFELRNGSHTLDTTNIDENDPEFAMHLFLNEFGWGKLDTPENSLHVVMVEETEDNPNENLMNCRK